jgi:hypothetical protein
MFTRDLERVARTMFSQRVSVEYLRHYLFETYQLDDKTLNQILEKIGAVQSKGSGKAAAKTQPMPDKANDRRSRQGFF